MKRRYSNFHRARKYYRRYLRSIRLKQHWHIDWLGELYQKYDHLTFYHDGVSATFVNVGTPSQAMVINGFGTPKSQCVADLSRLLELHPIEKSSQMVDFVKECHQFALDSLGINKAALEAISDDR